MNERMNEKVSEIKEENSMTNEKCGRRYVFIFLRKTAKTMQVMLQRKNKMEDRVKKKSIEDSKNDLIMMKKICEVWKKKK